VYFGLSDPVEDATNLIDNLCMKPGDKIATYNVDLMWYAERVQKRIAHWDKQNHAVPAPNCMLKVQGEIIKVEGL